MKQYRKLTHIESLAESFEIAVAEAADRDNVFTYTGYEKARDELLGAVEAGLDSVRERVEEEDDF